MTLYEILKTYIMTPLLDLSFFEGYGERVFYCIFALAMAAVVTHFVVIVPYRLLLRLSGYKRWRK